MSMFKLAKLAVGFMFAFSYLQVLSFCQSRGEDNSKQQVIVASLALSEPTACVTAKNRFVESKISFSNDSNEDIEITLEKGINVTVEGLFGTRTLKPLLWGGGSISESAPRSPVSHALLHPKEAVILPFQLRLTDGVYSEPGFYKVKVDFDVVGNEGHTGVPTVDYSATTNWAIFQVRECQSQH